MEKNILKIDLDMKNKKNVIKHLKERLSYVEDIGFFNVSEKIEKIILIKKSSYGCKIFLNENLKEEYSIVIFQLILGSDYMKEINTLYNHYVLEMQYSNRLFDCKRYKNGKIKIAKEINITTEILQYINSKKRKKSHN
jgi:hypothetical protein